MRHAPFFFYSAGPCLRDRNFCVKNGACRAKATFYGCAFTVCSENAVFAPRKGQLRKGRTFKPLNPVRRNIWASGAPIFFFDSDTVANEKSSVFERKATYQFSSFFGARRSYVNNFTPMALRAWGGSVFSSTGSLYSSPNPVSGPCRKL